MERCLYNATREGLICYQKCQDRHRLEELRYQQPDQFAILNCQLPEYKDLFKRKSTDIQGPKDKLLEPPST